MIGSIRWNIGLGLVGFFLTFVFSIAKNLFLTTLLRSLLCFLVLFAFAFLLRWFLGTVAGLKNLDQANGANAPRNVGQMVNMTTQGEEEALKQILKDNLRPPSDPPDFSPLNPPKLVSTKGNKSDPKELARMIRHLSED